MDERPQAVADPDSPDTAPLYVSVFMDYICPFCYVGHKRLERLRGRFAVRVNWCFLEIHPDTPPEGKPLADLGYAPEQWERMMQSLSVLAHEEGIVLADRKHLANSRKAILLAEAAKHDGPEVFYRLHESLFEAYFRDGLDIGDEVVLADLARRAGVSAATLDNAWTDDRHSERLKENLEFARRLRLTGVPLFIIGKQVLRGTVPFTALEGAADEALSLTMQ